MKPLASALVVLSFVLIAGCERKATAPEETPSEKSKAGNLAKIEKIIKDRREAGALETARAFPTRGAVFQPEPPHWYVGPRDDFMTVEGSVGALGQAYAMLTKCEVMVSASVATRRIKIVVIDKSREARRAAFDRTLIEAGIAVYRINEGTLVLSVADDPKEANQLSHDSH